MADIITIPGTKAEPAPDGPAEDLRALREARGLSLQDIFATTRISVFNLTALEKGDFKSLPPPIYTRHFVSKYAREIGFDEKPLLERYERYLATTNKPVEPQEIRKPWPESGWRYLFLYGSLAIVIAAGLIVLAVFLYHGDKPAAPPSPAAQSAPVQAAPPAVEPPAPVQAASPAVEPPVPGNTSPPVASSEKITAGLSQTTAAVSPAPENNVPPASGPGLKERYRLVIVARELTWIKIVEDKKNIREMLLQPGEKIERKAAEGFRLEIGNAGGVDLFFQQKPLGPLGKHGEVVNIRLPE